MCSIVGFFNVKDSQQKIINALNILKNRGKDGFGVYSDNLFLSSDWRDADKISASGNALGHTLHSVVGEKPLLQPLKGKGILVANCEIYNWAELKKKYCSTARNDAELLLEMLDKKDIADVLEELDGVYAFAYWINDKVYLARDIFGEKPIWYSAEEGFAFASEKKALSSFKLIDELNPRKLLIYDIKTKKLEFINRKFFKTTPVITDAPEIVEKEVEMLLKGAVEKRIPKKKFGLLFSGGLDSTVLALLFKKMNLDFCCYTACLEDEMLKEPEDLFYAKKAAKSLGLNLKVRRINLAQAEEYLKRIVPLIEDSSVVKSGVGLTFYVACELAKEDGIKVIFSGLGSEEIFAGYERHKKSIDINKECLQGLIKIYERDLYRDDVVTMHNNIELRLPFLDMNLVGYSLRIPAELKLNERENKIILRRVARNLGLEKELYERKKKAAQYGSNFDRAIEKLAKKNKFHLKSKYLDTFLNRPIMKLGVLSSGGKDGLYSAYVMKKQNYELSCIISIKSKNPDSYMFHTPNIHLSALQAQAMEIPIIVQETAGEKEEELNDLSKAIEKAKKEFHIEGVVVGAIFSNYQRERVEKVCDKLGLKIFAPLWHKDQEEYMKELVKNNFMAIITAIAADGLDKNFLGKEINEDIIKKLITINKKNNINLAGEGGEYESLVLECPLFKKKIKIVDAEIKMQNGCTGHCVVKKAELF